MTETAFSNHIHEFIRLFLSSVAAASLYGMSHQQVKRLSSVAMTSLTKALTVNSDIAILELEGELLIDNEPQPFSLVLEKFAKVMRNNRVGHIRFTAGIERAELDTFISLLAGKSDADDLGSTEHIRVGKVELKASGEDASSAHELDEFEFETRILRLEDIPSVELTRLAEVYYAVRRNERLKPSGVALTVAELANVFKREGEAMLVLAALREKDEYTFTHATNVCILSMAQALSLGIEGQLLNDIGIAAILHDIGKMFVPEEILLKPGRLTKEEFDLMKMHPVKGGRYLLETPGVPKLAAIVAYEHHMNDDLSGYPAAPSGWRMNFASQLVAISDIFDAMRTRRPYKEPHQAADIANLLIYKANQEFNPLIVNNFLNIIEKIKLPQVGV